MIPLALTSVTITRLPDGGEVDGYDELPPADTIQTGVRATIGSPSANTQLSGGTKVVTTWRAQLDLCDLQAGDIVTDADGNTFQCLSATVRKGLGLDHISAVLTVAEGAS